MSDSGPANKTRRNMLAAALAAGATAPAMARLITTNSSGTIMAGSLLPQPKQLFQDANWNPLIGGKIYTYAAGTLTPKPTYQDAALTIANTNPTVANARGEVLMYGTGAYRVLLKDAAGNTIYDVDNLESSASIVDTLRADLGAPVGAALVGWTQVGTGAVPRELADKNAERVSPGDFTTLQAAIDSCIATGRVSEAPAGVINISTKILFNGTGNVAIPNQQRPGILGFKGRGRFSTSVFKATAPMDYVIQGNNTSGVQYGNFSVDGGGLATGGIDFSWVGGSEGEPTLAPSNNNILENVMVQGCSNIGINLDQFHDSKISGIWVRGVGAEGIAISLQGAGGQLVIDNAWCSTGIFRIACQNAGVSNCGFFGGVQLTGAGFNNITWSGCHFYQRVANGVIISNDAIGNATRGAFFSGCYFNGCTYVTNGRWHQGATFIACKFGTWEQFADAENFTSAGGAGQIPVFTFKNCSFEGAVPIGVAGKFSVVIEACRNSAGQIITSPTYVNSAGSGQTIGRALVFSEKSVVDAGASLVFGIARGTFTLSILSVATSGAIRTHATYHIAIFDGDIFTAILLASSNGSGGGRSFTVTSPSPNVISINNTSASGVTISAAVIGVSS